MLFWNDCNSSSRSLIQICFFCTDWIWSIRIYSCALFLLRYQWWLKDWVRLFALLWFVTPTSTIHWNSIFTWIKKISPCPKICNSSKPFWLLNWVSIARMAALFSKVSLSQPTLNAAESKMPSFYACPSYQSKLCLSTVPRALLLSSQNLWLSNGIAFGSDYQMTGRG